jgi:large subunit ribosomal protein L31
MQGFPSGTVNSLDAQAYAAQGAKSIPHATSRLPPSDGASYIWTFAARQYPEKDETPVKAGIHPNYQRAVAQCACGNSFVTRSTIATIHLEVCAKCHPYYTGKLRLLDTAGRVERFRQKYGGDKVKP